MNNTHVKVAALPTIRRLPLYLRILKDLRDTGEQLVSGTYLAEKMHCEPIQVRKDLAVTGSEGRPRLGYNINNTIIAIETFLGWTNSHDAFLVGVGSLGSALLGYKGFEQHNLNIVAAFDNNPQKIGSFIHDKEVFSIDKLQDLALRMHVKIGILTVPSGCAQTIAELMVHSGISGIWNFSPTKLNVPSNIIVQYEDLSSGLAVLCRSLQTRN